MNNYRQFWEDSLILLKENMNQIAFRTWFSKVDFKEFDENTDTLYLYYYKEIAKEQILERYLKLLSESLEAVFYKKVRINFIDGSGANVGESLVEQVPVSTTSTVNEIFDEEKIISTRNTFENFVVGPNNEYAHAASLAVAENPATVNYNPLYLYSEPGLGKTHLMHSIALYILKNSKNKKILYVTSEMFTNEFISATKNNKIDEFRNKYRSMDILLLDDVQFFAKKAQTQEEVFNTFNALHDNNKQIVLSSDRPPSELEISQRLKQRFGWKIIAEIKKPEYETRLAILEKKPEEAGLELTADLKSVLNMIASGVDGSVRILESTFTNILNISQFMGTDITPELVRERANYLFKDANTSIDVEGIKKIVCEYYGISTRDIESKKRSRDIAYPRQIAVFLSRELTDLSFPSIGEYFGGRDHTTMMHAYNKINEELQNNESTKHNVNELINKIKI